MSRTENGHCDNSSQTGAFIFTDCGTNSEVNDSIEVTDCGTNTEVLKDVLMVDPYGKIIRVKEKNNSRIKRLWRT